MTTKLIAVALVLFCAFGGAAECRAQSCGALPANAARVVSALQQKNYFVQCGTVHFSINNAGQCDNTNGVVNPSTCYGQYNLPQRNGSSANGAFMIDDDEAVMTLGTLPPPMNYYGYYTYLDARIDPTASPPVYEDVGAPFGPVMNQSVADPGLHAQFGGTTYQLFDAPTTIVTTANTVTLGDISKAVASVYGSAQAQNTLYVEKMPVDLLDLGSAGDADKFKTAIRLTPFVTASGDFDPIALDYMQNPPLLVFRVSPAAPRTGVASATYHLANDPMPQTKIEPGKVWEQILLTTLGVPDAYQAMSTIIDNVISSRAAMGATLQSTVMPSNGSALQGRKCIDAYAQGVAKAEQNGTRLVLTNAMNCVDGSPDAAYYGPKFGRKLSYPTGGELVWVGVNHGTLGSADYSSLAVQSPSENVAGLTNATLIGSATPYLGTDVPKAAASAFYVVSFSEACTAGEPYCLYLPSNTHVVLDERAYLAPMTGTQPDYTDIIPSVWLIFNPPG